jgi:ABC-type phosphate/phosphonate transport system ATPase subunit
MASKIVQFKQIDMFPNLNEKKPIQRMTEEEFVEIVKNCFAGVFNSLDQMKSSFKRIFATFDEMEKFNEFLTLHQLDIQDKIIEQEEELSKLKNP